jgi:hypothetical protein
MTKDSRPHTLGFPDEYKRDIERAAALLNKKDWAAAVGLGMRMVQLYSEAYVKGKINYMFCTSELEACIESNPAFFEALCQEGVVEWLTPFVLTKNVPQSEQIQ